MQKSMTHAGSSLSPQMQLDVALSWAHMLFVRNSAVAAPAASLKEILEALPAHKGVHELHSGAPCLSNLEPRAPSFPRGLLSHPVSLC